MLNKVIVKKINVIMKKGTAEPGKGISGFCIG